MAKHKYYAVRIGDKPGIYETWAECEAQIKGISGAVYKAFPTFGEAEKFIMDDLETSKQEITTDDMNNNVVARLKELQEDEVIAFVDGSYNSKEEKAGFGVIIIDDKGIETPLYRSIGKEYDPEFLQLRNVAAELEGVKEAINWAVTYGKKHIDIYYDYQGIEAWSNGSWKANNDITRKYVSFISKQREIIEVSFIKVSAHSGVEYNERADRLAKNSLLEKGYKTYNDGSIYFVGFSAVDWKAIVDCINSEDEDLNDGANNIIVVKDSKVNGNRERLIITNDRNKVVINCYQNVNSYVQGKQSMLFQKIISIAIELMSDEQKVIETLNHVHVLTISQNEVENKFESVLPNYNGEYKGKFYNNLLAVVYNTMITGYMPDYTSLLTPMFRAYEYYLHHILGDKMGLNTCDENGKNNFSYFGKNSSGGYFCSSGQVSKLSNEQKDFLNVLYNKYHGIRHPYTHWSADNYDTAVITSIEKAKNYLQEGLTLVNQYYKIYNLN